MRDDVVQFLRDTQALLHDGALGQQLALAVETLGALAEGVDAGALRADVEAEAGGDGAQQRERQLMRSKSGPPTARNSGARDDDAGHRGDGLLPSAPRADRVEDDHEPELEGQRNR